MLKRFLNKAIVAVVASTLLMPVCASAACRSCGGLGKSSEVGKALVSGYQVEDQPQVMEKALQLTQRGILKLKGKNDLYLEVSKDYVSELVPLIQTQGKVKLPWFVKSKHGIGVHIPVVQEGDKLTVKGKKIVELEKEIAFVVKEVRSTIVPRRKHIQRIWVLGVDSPELDQLRAKYGLTAKEGGYAITLGTEYSRVTKNKEVSTNKEAE